jgi:hypothetical protein
VTSAVLKATLAMLLALAAAVPSAAAAPDDGLWDVLLREHVRNGLVDYDGLAAHRLSLDIYLTSLRETNSATLSSADARLAFWINAYNACAVRLVIDRQPITSVRQVNGFFSTQACEVAGSARSLDEIEAEGRRLGDWRILPAIARASAGSPPLRSEAYTPERLDDQLADQTLHFLADPRRGVRLDGKVLRVSQLFKWRALDFIPTLDGPSTRPTAEQLLIVLLPYLEPTLADAMRVLKPSVKYLDYDWTLNALRKPAE